LKALLIAFPILNILFILDILLNFLLECRQDFPATVHAAVIEVATVLGGYFFGKILR
jgi:hypothetical protein